MYAGKCEFPDSHTPNMKRTQTVILALLVVLSSHVHSLAAMSFGEGVFKKLAVDFQRTPTTLLSTYPIDIDCDAVDELLILEENIGIHVYDHNLRDFKQVYRIESIKSPQLISRGDECPAYIVFDRETEQMTEFQVLRFGRGIGKNEGRGNLETVFVDSATARYRESMGTLTIVAVADVNKDSVPDYVGFRAGRSRLESRGITLIDGASRNVVWYREIGPLPQFTTLCDLNSDGTQEIVFVGASVDNGNQGSGLTDSQSYLLALDITGSFLWPPLCIGGVLTYPRFVIIPDANGSDSNLVVAARSHENSVSDQPLLIVSGKSGNVIHRRNFEGGIKSVAAVKDNRSGEIEIIAVGQEGTLIAADTNLISRSVEEFSEPIEDILISADFDGDESQELAVVTTLNTMMILDLTFTEVLKHSFSGPVHSITRFRSVQDSVQQFLCQSDQVYCMTFSWQPKSFSEIVPPTAQAIVIIASLSTAFVAVVYSRQRRRYLEILNVLLNDPNRCVIAVDGAGRIYRVNDRADDQWKIRETFVGMTFDALQREPNLRPIYEIISSFLVQRRAAWQTTFAQSDGTQRREYSANLFRLTYRPRKSRFTVVVMIEDITALSQSKEYEAWKTLSAGIAHDLRKPLAPLKLILQDMQVKFQDGPINRDAAQSRYLVPAIGQIDRLARYVERLSVLSQPTGVKSDVFDLSSLVDYIVKMQFSADSDGVRIKLNVGDSLPLIQGNQVEIERMVIELLDNARAAVKDRSSPEIVVNLYKSVDLDNHLRLEIRDNGTGIETQIMKDVFKPYFTTRDGQHQGLGLWSVQRIVNEHNGRIHLESTVEVGTVLAVDLPGA